MGRFFGQRYLFMACVFFCEMAYASPGAPHPESSISHDHSYGHAENGKYQSQVFQIGTESSPAVVRVIPAPVSEMEEKKQRYESEWKPTLDTAVMIATVVMALLSMAMAFYTYRLWKSSQDNFDITFKHMRSSTKDQLRAYIGPESACYSSEKGADDKIIINVKNFGSTRASQVTAESRHLVSGSALYSTWREDAVHVPGHNFGIIEPGHSFNMVIQAPIIRPIERMKLFVEAEVKYQDAFGNSYVRTFTYYLPKGSFFNRMRRVALNIKPNENQERVV